MGDGMKSIWELLQGSFADIGDSAGTFETFGALPHIEAREGDFVGDDGYLHCGVCGQRKECRFRLSGRMVPVMCDCKRAEAAAEDDARRREQERGRIQELLSFSLIDALFYECTFDRFVARDDKEHQYLNRLRNYAENFELFYRRNKGLLLYGPPGTGKTFGAACIANKLIADGIPVFVTSIVKLTSGGVFDDDLRHTLDIMHNARLLVIDDLGAERNTDFKTEQLFEIIDSRINSQKPMIVTTNITDFRGEKDIRRRRVYDRLNGACIPIFVDGDSRRRQAAAAEYKQLMAILDGDING